MKKKINGEKWKVKEWSEAKQHSSLLKEQPSLVLFRIVEELNFPSARWIMNDLPCFGTRNCKCDFDHITTVTNIPTTPRHQCYNIIAPKEKKIGRRKTSSL